MAYEVGLALKTALIEGNVNEVERILTEADSDDFPVNSFIGDYVKGSGQFLEPTALTIASEYGHTECVKKILQLGGKLYTTGITEDEDDETLSEASVYLSEDYFGALVIAASKGYTDVVQLLTEFRLFDTAKMADGYREFIAAAKIGDFQKIKILLDSLEEKEDVLNGWKGHNIMNFCLLLGCPPQCLQTLIDHGVKVNGWDYNGLTPLMCAIIGRNLGCVEFLLQKGADPYEIHILRRLSFRDDGPVLYIDDMGTERLLEPNFRDEWLDFRQDYVGPTALMYAAAMGNIPILKLMLGVAAKDIGTLARFEQFRGIGPLMFAIDYAHVEAVSLILQFDAAREEVGYKPLCSAICDGKTDVIEALLRSKILWDDEDTVFGLAMLKCVEKNKPQYLDKILSFIDKNVFELDDGRAFFYAISDELVECVNVFIKRPEFSVDFKCGNAYFKSASGLTGLMFSCRKGSDVIARMFFEMGANVNATEATGKTAVMFAAYENHVNCLEFLKDLQANFDIVDELGGTVFSAALLGDGSCLEYLLKTGKLLDDSGLKPMHKQSLRFFNIGIQDNGFGGCQKVMSIKNIQLLIKYKIFFWDWCSMVSRAYLKTLVFAAVTSRLSPGKLHYNNELISPFTYTIMIKDAATLRYLVANLFFLSEDYTMLHSFTNYVMSLNESSDMRYFIEQLGIQPLSLSVWSFLTISKCFAGDPLTDRKSQVDMLPLPTALKNILSFKKDFSHLCPRHWNKLGPQKGEINFKGFDFLMVNGNIVRNPILEICRNKNCLCLGSGLTMRELEHEDESEEESINFDEISIVFEDSDEYDEVILEFNANQEDLESDIE